MGGFWQDRRLFRLSNSISINLHSGPSPFRKDTWLAIQMHEISQIAVWGRESTADLRATWPVGWILDFLHSGDPVIYLRLGESKQYESVPCLFHARFLIETTDMKCNDES
jgi:hypothetical protein